MSEGQRPLKITEDLDRYLKFQYVQVESNYWLSPLEYFKKKVYNVRQCDERDFITVDDNPKKSLYNDWKSYSILCPDIPANDDFKLEGDNSMMKSQNYQFEIHYCNSTERKEKNLSPCYDLNKTKEYIQDIQINLWTAQFEIDYHIYDKKPLYINQQILKTTLLSPKEIQRSQISLIQSTYET